MTEKAARGLYDDHWPKPQAEPAPMGWHVISGEDLLDALRRVEAGEKPDLVYAELYVNADREDFRDE